MYRCVGLQGLKRQVYVGAEAKLTVKARFGF